MQHVGLIKITVPSERRTLKLDRAVKIINRDGIGGMGRKVIKKRFKTSRARQRITLLEKDG